MFFSKNNFLKSLFFFNIIFLSILNSEIISKIDLCNFKNLVETSESFYLDENTSKDFSFDQKLDALYDLCEYKQKFNELLSGLNSEKKDLVDQKDCDDLEKIFMPLTKEIIRHHKYHLAMPYGWHENLHFESIFKPIAYSGGLCLASILLAKILEKSEVIPQAFYDKTKLGIFSACSAATILWIAYNYRYEISRKIGLLSKKS